MLISQAGDAPGLITSCSNRNLLVVSDPSQMSEIILTTSDGQTLDTLVRSTSIPQVSFDPLPVEIQDQATITWQANDGDGDSLYSTLYYSNNGGLNWQVLGIDIPGRSFNLNAAELPGGSGLFKVSVSGGFNTAENISTPVSLPDQAPIITMIQPWGTDFEYHETDSMEAVGYDLEDGLLPPDAIQWSDTHGTQLGVGNMLHTTMLAVGNNQLTAQVQDSTGKVSQTSVVINITGNALIANLPVSILLTSAFPILGLCACISLLGGVFLAGGAFLVNWRKKISRSPGGGGGGQAVQDQQGNWWYQDSENGRWYFWNGQAWLPTPGTTSNLAAPQRVPVNKTSRGWESCLLSLLLSGGIALAVVGGVSLVAFNFLPAYQITVGQGDMSQILKVGGGGLLATLLGFLFFNSGLRAILTRRAFTEDDWGHRTEKRGCSTIFNGLGQLFFGLLCLIGGLGMMTLTFYQEVLPLLGF